MAIVPNLASLQAETMTICESTTAASPTAHQIRGARMSRAPVAKSAREAVSQAMPAAREIGASSRGSSAKSNAVANPSR